MTFACKRCGRQKMWIDSGSGPGWEAHVGGGQHCDPAAATEFRAAARTGENPAGKCLPELPARQLLPDNGLRQWSGER
jgi:hypothetical protein